MIIRALKGAHLRRFIRNQMNSRTNRMDIDTWVEVMKLNLEQDNLYDKSKPVQQS